MKRLLILGIVVALCLIATPVVASYSCNPLCDPDPIGSDKCCFGSGTPESTNLVTPDEWNANPTCADLGFDSGSGNLFPAGTYPVGPGSITWSVDGNGLITWSSTFGIDAAFVKGGDGGNLYVYVPESTGDSGLGTPINPSGEPAGLSHMLFCYDNDDECECETDSDCDRGNECEIGVCNQECTCDYTFVEEGESCDEVGTSTGLAIVKYQSQSRNSPHSPYQYP